MRPTASRAKCPLRQPAAMTGLLFGVCYCRSTVSPYPASPPSNCPLANALTFDVEDYYHVQAFADVILRSDWEGLKPRVEENTCRLLDLLAERRVRATFYVLGWVARRHPSLVRKIAAGGHEVACHGMYHTLVYTQTPDTFREETRASKSLLEDLVQTPVIGYRAATFSVTIESLWALDILAEEGFRHDSSVFPIHHDRYGLPHAPRFAFTVQLGDGRKLTEFPLSTIEVLGLRLPIAGGGYFRLLPFFLTRLALARVNRRERKAFVFYLHPWEIDPDQPRVRTPSRLRSARHRLNLGRAESRLRRLLGHFVFAPMSDVIAAQAPSWTVPLDALAGPRRA
jgi:polysaccharide deacetylase family protein (PEP-CTERM system associated)